MTQIEVEVRGRLSKKEYDTLESFLKENAEFVESKHRVLIDYSTLLPGEGVAKRTRDIRLRATNGKPEIITKIGTWGGRESRKEISIFTEEGSFDALVENYAVLGYEKGILCVRHTEVYSYKDIEFALVEVPKHSYYFEAELLLSEEDDADVAHTKLKSVCDSLNLTLFDDAGFYTYIEQLNAEANELFDFTKTEPGYFKKRFGL